MNSATGMATLTKPVDSAMKHNFNGPLEESIFKATKSNEKSPIKDKHLKLIVSESWRTQHSEAIFAHLLSKRPLASKEVVLYKTLGVTHTLLRDGHPSCVAAANQQEAILKSLQNQCSTTTTSSYSLINNHYISFILQKLKFHVTFSGLAGTLGIQEYRDKHKAWNAKFTFAVVQQLLALQQAIINFQNTVFGSQGLNPCKLSCIIPAIKESHAVYLLTVQLLNDLHDHADTTSFPLNELVDAFNTQYPLISKFYFTCTGIPYITAVMTVPSLSREGPPRFERKAALPSQPKKPAVVQPQPVFTPTHTPAPAPAAGPDPLLLFGLQANFTPLPPQFTNFNAPPAALTTTNPFMTSNPGTPVANPFATTTAAAPVARYAAVPQIDPSETREALEKKIAELEAKLRQLLAHLKSLEEENARLKAQLSAKDSTASAARIEMELKLKQQQEQAEAAARAIKEHILQLQQKYEQEKLKLISDQVSFAKNSVHQYLFRFDDPNFAGNRNAMADDILNGTAHLQESFQLLVSTLEDEGDVVGASRLLADHTQKFLADAKGLSNRVDDPELKLQLTEGARSAGRITAKLLTDAQELSARGKLTPQERDRLRGNQNIFIDNLVGVRNAITNSTKKKDDNNVDSIAERELMKAAKIIADAAASLKEQAARSQAGQNSLNPADWAAHAAIAESALGITHATQMLLNAAAAAQQERVARGIEKTAAGETYHSDPMWAEGLISAAKAVANSTRILVSSANKAIDGNVDEATLTACCRAVAAHTAKLQQATRVKAEHNSKAQAQLDNAAKLVKDSTNGLVEETKRYSAFEEAQVKVGATGTGFNNIKAERELEGTIGRLKAELEKSNNELYKFRKDAYGTAHQKATVLKASAPPEKPKISNYSHLIDSSPIVSPFGDKSIVRSAPDEEVEKEMPKYMQKKLAPVELAPEKIDLKAKPELEVKPRPLHLQNDAPHSNFTSSSSPLPSPSVVQHKPVASHTVSDPRNQGNAADDDDDAMPAYMRKKLAPVSLVQDKVDLKAKPELEVKMRPVHLQSDLSAGSSLPPPAGNSNPFGAPPAGNSNPFGAPPPGGNANPFGNPLPPPSGGSSNPFGAPLPPPSQSYSSNPWG